MKTLNTLTATVPLTPSQYREAADLAEQIESLQGQLNGLLSGGIVTGTKPTAKAPAGKRKFSPAVRARIAAGQKAAWARRAAAKANPAPATPPVASTQPATSGQPTA